MRGRERQAVDHGDRSVLSGGLGDPETKRLVGVFGSGRASDGHKAVGNPFGIRGRLAAQNVARERAFNQEGRHDTHELNTGTGSVPLRDRSVDTPGRSTSSAVGRTEGW